MKITPLDIQQRGFRTKLRGYHREEVDRFLDQLTQEFETLIKENNALRQRLSDLESEMAEMRKKEASLNAAVVKAQDLMEELKSRAQKEADLTIKEAELKAEEIVKSGRDQLAALKREVLDLQKQKMLFIERVRSLVRGFGRVLDLEDREDEARSEKAGTGGTDEREDNVKLFRPKTP
jgi:cell division initiation protein